MSGRSHRQQWRRLSVIEPNDSELPAKPTQRTGEPEARARCAGQLGLATRIIMSNAWQDPDVPARSANHQTDSSIMAKLFKIAKTKDVPPGQAAAFTIEGQKIALFNVEGTYYAIGDTCTHLGEPLSEGDVQVTRATLPCPGSNSALTPAPPPVP